MAKRKRSTRYPSQVRYDEKHPTLSFRLDRDEYNELSELSKKSETPIRTLVREAVGLLAKGDRYHKGHSDGYRKGYETARKKYEIQYPCARCGKMMTMRPGDEDHKAMQQFLQKEGWYHQKCP